MGGCEFITVVRTEYVSPGLSDRSIISFILGSRLKARWLEEERIIGTDFRNKAVGCTERF